MSSAPELDIDQVRAPALEMRGITKRYPGVVANDHIDLDVRPGEIHALLGENGAGKTTLMNILYGLARPDEGEILIDGSPVRIADPTDAIARGINMVHQHFMLVPVMTVAENILLGEETMANPIFLDQRESKRRIVELGQRFGFEIDPDVKVGELSVGWQQRVEILKALYRNARVLVLDEPTAVLTPQETEEIFAVLRRLAEAGHSIVFISHKLYEVLEIADRITVIRRGRVVGSRIPSETDEDDLAALMVGRDVQLVVDRGESHPAEARLKVEALRVLDDRGAEAVRGVDFEVRSGEIFGIAGVAGNGQDELVEAIVGLRKPAGGTVTLDGTDVTDASARQMTNLGTGYVPADRHRFGLVLGFSVADNLVLTDYYHAPYSRGILRNDAAIEERGNAAIKEYDIRTPSADVTAGTLSGGNQQKIIVARELAGDLRLLVLDQPTRGLDVGSIEFIHRQAIKRRDAGTAILLVSAELDEVLELSDRVAVMYRGQIVAVIDGRTADRNEVGILMATGIRQEAAVASGQISAEEAAAAAAGPEAES
ncbi:MAG TPA: ABC transporter ATP-binding protein [Candidatus Limnocylindrales bacterium]|nr:ABC transporter ATP-binding protein [Candidatus Limnocylindrales bacterium]